MPEELNMKFVCNLSSLKHLKWNIHITRQQGAYDYGNLERELDDIEDILLLARKVSAEYLYL